MRNDLLFGILITLLNEGKCSAPYLANKFEVSTRTIERYLLTLEMSGIPTYSETGRYGGTRIVGSFSVDNLFFSKDELSRLFLHLESSPLKGLDTIDKQISTKINFQLNNKLRHKAPESCVYIDPTCWCDEPLIREHIKNLQTAITKQLDIELDYNSTTSGHTQRRISPTLIVNKECKWHFLGFCHKAKELRLFKISRIQSISLCERDPDTIIASREESIAHLKTLFKKREITIQTHKNNYYDIRQWMDILEVKTKENDLLEIHGLAVDNCGLLHKLICYENKLKVIQPKELQTKLVDICNSITQTYAIN